MFDNKFLMTLIGLVVAVVAINNFKKDDDKIEDFGMLPSFQTKIDVMAAKNSASAKKGDFFSVPGTYQAQLSPRFSNVDYGANIRYNMPSYNNQASPCQPLGYAANPLTFASMVQNSKENYVPDTRHNSTLKENYGHSSSVENYGCNSCGGGCGAVGCRKGGAPPSFNGGAPLMPGNGYANGNFNEITEKLYEDVQAGGSSYDKRASMYCGGDDTNSQSTVSLSSSLPVRDMTSMNAGTDNSQPIVYDRYMFANRNSRLRSRGDKIRGDLAILPCNTGWFQVSVQPNIDLEAGALNVLAGIGNEQGQAISNLVYKTSGNSQTAVSGVNLANEVNLATQFGGGLLSAQGDVQVTAYP